jgi:hypothetical protein
MLSGQHFFAQVDTTAAPNLAGCDAPTCRAVPYNGFIGIWR